MDVEKIIPISAKEIRKTSVELYIKNTNEINQTEEIKIVSTTSRSFRASRKLKQIYHYLVSPWSNDPNQTEELSIHNRPLERTLSPALHDISYNNFYEGNFLTISESSSTCLTPKNNSNDYLLNEFPINIQEAQKQRERIQDKIYLLNKEIKNDSIVYFSDNEDNSIKEISNQLNKLEAQLSSINQFINNDPCSEKSIKQAIRLFKDASFCFLEKEVYFNEKNKIYNSNQFFIQVENTKDQIRKCIQDIYADIPSLETSAIMQAKNEIIGILKSKDFIQDKKIKDALKQAHAHVLNAHNWEVIEKRIPLSIYGSQYLIDSVIIPAKQLGNVFIDIYDKKNGICSHSTSERLHSVNLCKTILTDSNQKTLFEAYRHGVHCAYGIKDPNIRHAANRNRAIETITAMVIGDFNLLGQAIYTSSTENPIPLKVFSINLQTPDNIRSLSSPLLGNLYNERLHIKEQAEAWASINNQTLNLKVNDLYGQITSIYIRPEIQAVNFGVNSIALEGLGKISSQSRLLGTWPTVEDMNNNSLSWLFGEGYSQNDFSGEVEKYLQSETDESKACIIEELSNQIIDIYTSGSYKTAGNEPYKIVTRLAILCNLMDIKVAFNCKSGKDRTGMMDSETKFLMSRIYFEQMVPEPDEQLSQNEKTNLFKIVALGGNHEIQKYNTGIAGYKPDNSVSLERLGGQEAITYIRGPSAYVSA